MTSPTNRNRAYLTDLFAGDFRGHAIIMDTEALTAPGIGDYAVSDVPQSEWLTHILKGYEAQLTLLDKIPHDAVPYARLGTGTELFAAAFGCKVHIFPDSPPAARPLVFTSAEADKLHIPSLDTYPLNRVFEMARNVRQHAGQDVPIGVPDIQSAFDIAALIWNKEDFYIASIQEPDAVRRLVEKCQTLLERFFDAFIAECPEVNLCHCPTAWAPKELGVWLSEDEIGAMSVAMFEEFCLPLLNRLSDRYGGLFVHCCATADHQYRSFKKIRKLRGLNRVFQSPGPKPAIDMFSGDTVFMVAWTSEEDVYKMLDMAHPNTRFLFNMGAQPLDEARRTFERMRERCPRSE